MRESHKRGKPNNLEARQKVPDDNSSWDLLARIDLIVGICLRNQHEGKNPGLDVITAHIHYRFHCLVSSFGHYFRYAIAYNLDILEVGHLSPGYTSTAPGLPTPRDTWEQVHPGSSSYCVTKVGP